MSQGGFTNAEKRIIAELYSTTRLMVDELPYTDEFERICAAFRERSGRDRSHREVWRLLLNARKAGLLERKER